MNIPSYLDLFTSLAFIFLLLSVIVSGVNEIIVYVLQKRGNFLKKVLREIFDDSKLNKNFSEIFFEHPLIDRLKKTQNSLPSYISSESFAVAMIDVIGKEYERQHILFKQDPHSLLITVDDKPKETDLLARFSKGVELMKHSDLKVFLRTFSERSKNYDELKANLEKWYNDYMDRVSGWYKNEMQMKMFWLGLVIAIFMNVDAIKLTTELYRNQSLRTQVADAADAYVQQNKDSLRSENDLKKIVQNIDTAYNQLKVYDLPIGWSSPQVYIHTTKKQFNNKSPAHSWWPFIKEIIYKILGWLVTAFAVSFGAPFWFDLLNKLVDLRKSGKKPKPADAKKD